MDDQARAATGKRREPNREFRRAHERLRTPSGMVPSRREIADLVNVFLHDVDPAEPFVDRNYVGKIESGVLRWPRPIRRAAFRHVFGVRTDAELGFRPRRDRPTDDSSPLSDLASTGSMATDPVDRGLRREIGHGQTVRSQEAYRVAALAPPIVVPQRNVAAERLRGRDLLLGDIQKVLSIGVVRDARTPRVLVLCGAGGIGKTTMALEIAHRAMDERVATWWVPATDPDAARAAMYAVAFAAGAREHDFDHAHPADVLWQHLDRRDSPWLLVIDNLDDPDVLAEAGHTVADGVGWLRPITNPQGRILITSRDARPERWAPWISLRSVSHLGPDSGGAVLLDLAPTAGSVADARALASALEGLPLALDLAGRFLAAATSDLLRDVDGVLSFHAYRDTLDQRLMELPMTADAHRDDRRTRRTVGETWSLSVELLRRQGHELALPLTRLLASFPPYAIPIQLVLRDDALRRRESFAAATTRSLSRCLAALQGIGVITVEDSSGMDRPMLVTMHPLVRAAVLADLRTDTRADIGPDLIAALLATAAEDLDPDDASTWSRWSCLAPHCLAIFKAATGGDLHLVNGPAVALRAAHRAVWYKYMAGIYQQARADASDIADGCRRIWGPISQQTLHARNTLARCVREAGDAESAEQDFHAILDLARRHLGESDPTTISIRINLARTVRERGDMAAAETQFRSIIDTAGSVLGIDHPDTLVARLNLAMTLRGQRRYQDAQAEYRRALTGWRRSFPDHDLTTLDIRYEIAETMRQTGDIESAQTELRTILGIAARVYGDDHPNTLIIRHGLATTLHAAGRIDAARTEIQQILALRQRRLGADHPMTLSIRTELAELNR